MCSCVVFVVVMRNFEIVIKKLPCRGDNELVSLEIYARTRIAQTRTYTHTHTDAHTSIHHTHDDIE